MEFKNYRKFLIPAVAVALIVNANITRKTDKVANFPSAIEAKNACLEFLAEREIAIKSNPNQIGYSVHCPHAPESRHHYYKERVQLMTQLPGNYSNKKDRLSCQKKMKSVEKKYLKSMGKESFFVYCTAFRIEKAVWEQMIKEGNYEWWYRSPAVKGEKRGYLGDELLLLEFSQPILKRFYY